MIISEVAENFLICAARSPAKIFPTPTKEDKITTLALKNNG